jgi:hypothetical protein
LKFAPYRRTFIYITNTGEVTMGFFSELRGNAGVLDAEKLTTDYSKLLTPEETIELGFKVIRDTFIFTTKRLILVDIQGLTGKKTEYMSIPYRKITKFSVETAGTFDLDAELKIWVGNAQMPLVKKFNKKVNIYDVQNVLATYVLG